MSVIRCSGSRATREIISSIMNWVCPECGGRMGGRGGEFKCQGNCQFDWRELWERSRKQV